MATAESFDLVFAQRGSGIDRILCTLVLGKITVRKGKHEGHANTNDLGTNRPMYFYYLYVVVGRGDPDDALAPVLSLPVLYLAPVLYLRDPQCI